jgi:hypothetical protein
MRDSRVLLCIVLSYPLAHTEHLEKQSFSEKMCSVKRHEGSSADYDEYKRIIVTLQKGCTPELP